jgi:hypothetical protein
VRAEVKERKVAAHASPGKFPALANGNALDHVASEQREEGMSRNPIYTVLGLALLATELVKPRERAVSADPQSKPPALLPWMIGWMKPTETTTVALLAAINAPLVALWANAMANIYAESGEVRCDALAMANFSATSVRTVVTFTAIFWAVSALLRWAAKFRPSFAIIWLFWLLLIGFPSFLMFVFSGQLYVEHLPVRLPPHDDLAACRQLITGPKRAFE